MSSSPQDDTEARASLIRQELADGGFHAWLKPRLLSHDSEAGRVTIACSWHDGFERDTASGQWHGGPIAALIDIAGDYALVAKLGHGVPTINLRIDYLRPATDRTNLTASAFVQRAGRSIGFVDIEVTDDRGRVIATGRGNYSTVAG
jgi:uncharacterized protein (TIGR00369 family)